MNLRVYGQVEPPEIDLSPITDNGVPIAFLQANDDLIAHSKDTEWLLKQIGEKPFVSVDYIDGGHNIFMIGKDPYFLEDIVLENIRKFT